eukprot:26113-Eustigmatos_ZCMA.PRE.1
MRMRSTMIAAIMTTITQRRTIRRLFVDAQRCVVTQWTHMGGIDSRSHFDTLCLCWCSTYDPHNYRVCYVSVYHMQIGCALWGPCRGDDMPAFGTLVAP